jgi:hypothetical protein
MKYKRLQFLLIFLLFFSIGAGENPTQNNVNGLVVNELSVENRKAARIEILAQMVNKYENNQTFDKVHDYMVLKYQELHKSKQPESPGLVIQETFKKARSLFDHTRPFVGSSFARVYDPALIEKKVQRYIWLKGLCFIVLGIGDEHRIALSYFYLPGNEDLKQDFLKDVVIYSFPEVPDVPENYAWQSDMMAVMDRLGYSIFNIRKFVPQKASTE